MHDHMERMEDALALEAIAHAALLKGDEEVGRTGMAEAAKRWRESWEGAPPRSFGRLVGMLKASVIAGDAVEAARYCRAALGEKGDSPTSWYALAIAALVLGDDRQAAIAAEEMRSGGGAFERAAEAIAALAHTDPERYGGALADIVTDFERRAEHLTGVAIADTAVMMEKLAEVRGIPVHTDSPVLPPPPE